MNTRWRWWYLMSWLLGAAVLLSMKIALGAPPPGADPNSPIAEWFHSLKQPGTGYICCTMSDGRTVVTRYAHGRLEAFVDRKSFGPTAPDAWVEVPEKVMIRGIENPNGEPVLFWYGGEVRCFVDGGSS